MVHITDARTLGAHCGSDVPADSAPPRTTTCYRLSAIVPVFNEAGNLLPLDEELRATLSELQGNHEIIYVDDGSTDGSLGVLLSILDRRHDDKVATRLVRLRRNFGQTSAMAAGFSQARGEIVVALDADRQNSPSDIPRLVEKLESGFDVVSGWRRDRKDALVRVLPSRIANRLIGWIGGVRLHDYGCTLKAYRREVLQGLHLYGEMHRFIPVYLARRGARVTELAVSHHPRVAGRSKYGFRRIPKVLLDLVLILFMSRYFDRPMHFFGQAALWFMGAFSLVATLMVVFKYGWLSLIGIQYRASFIETPLPALAVTFLTAAILSVFLGILGEILIRVYYELQRLRPYSIAEVLPAEEP